MRAAAFSMRCQRRKQAAMLRSWGDFTAVSKYNRSLVLRARMRAQRAKLEQAFCVWAVMSQEMTQRRQQALSKAIDQSRAQTLTIFQAWRLAASRSTKLHACIRLFERWKRVQVVTHAFHAWAAAVSMARATDQAALELARRAVSRHVGLLFNAWHATARERGVQAATVQRAMAKRSSRILHGAFAEWLVCTNERISRARAAR
jgi:hypothetical protein